MSKIERRAILAGMAALPLATPGLLRAQTSATPARPVQIGLLSDMSGPFRDVGGPGNRVAAELAIQDFGGSVLGRPITTRQADGQNRADVSAGLAREWIDNLGVDVLVDGAASSSGLAIQEVCREKKRIYLITGPATSDMTGAKCSPYGIHFGFDTYALAHGTGTALTKSGGDSWYFITSDYAFGHALERDTMAAVRAAGGKVLGAVRAPLNNADFSSLPDPGAGLGRAPGAAPRPRRRCAAGDRGRWSGTDAGPSPSRARNASLRRWSPSRASPR